MVFGIHLGFHLNLPSTWDDDLSVDGGSMDLFLFVFVGISPSFTAPSLIPCYHMEY
jgi:hypothetical protein